LDNVVGGGGGGSTSLSGPWPPQANVASNLSCAAACQFLQPSFLASSSTPSIHFDFGWPRLC